jgi:hypothetical protein
MPAARYPMHPLPAKVEEYLDDIADAMVSRYGIPLAEAVARINEHWEGLAFEEEDDDDLIFHELPEFWAGLIYYGRDAPHWDPDADLSSWQPRPAPPADSPAWTL